MKQNKRTVAQLKKEVSIKAPLRIDLGCGENCTSTPEGIKFTGIDLYKVKGVDIVHNLKKYPWPFKDNSVDEAFSSHFVEHLTGMERIPFFNELGRILKPGAKVRICTPHPRSVRAIQDPSHMWPPLCENFYYYLSNEWREANKLNHYLGLTCNFKILPTCFYTWQDQAVALKNEETRTFWVDKYCNVVADLIMDIEKI